MTTNVPPIQFTLQGLILPAEADILAGELADFNAAFGGGMDLGLETPQGQLASSITEILGNANDLFAYYVNQVDPAYAAGRMQDAIGRIYFIERKPALPTAVQCDCVGLQDTIIPIGAQAIDTSSNIYICVEGGIIPIGGTISLAFACQQTGPIACAANTLNRIYQAIPGWDTINNPLDGVPGSDVESRADFEFRRGQSVALNGHGSLQSIYGAVFDLPDVLDVFATENVTSAPITVGATNTTLVPHSLYVAAVGGDPQLIANTIWLKKDLGCDYNGNTVRTVYDTQGYDPPYPAYTVKYEIPPSLPVYFAIQIANNSNLPANIITMVQGALLSAFVGGDGGPRARIGSTIYASRYYCPLAVVFSGLGILSLTVGASASPVATSLAVGIDQAPVLTRSNIAVTLV